MGHGINFSRDYWQIDQDWKAFLEEWKAIYSEATFLGTMEWHYLDKYGGTTHIQKLLRQGYLNIDADEAMEYKAKYAHLRPTWYGATPFGIFEARFVDQAGDISRIERHLKMGWDIFNGVDHEIQLKYGQLRECYAWQVADIKIGEEWQTHEKKRLLFENETPS